MLIGLGLGVARMGAGGGGDEPAVVESFSANPSAGLPIAGDLTWTQNTLQNSTPVWALVPGGGWRLTLTPSGADTAIFSFRHSILDPANFTDYSFLKLDYELEQNDASKGVNFSIQGRGAPSATDGSVTDGSTGLHTMTFDRAQLSAWGTFQISCQITSNAPSTAALIMKLSNMRFE